MKTTIEIPDDLMRMAKSTAARRGMSFKLLVIEALKRVMASSPSAACDPEWMRCFGAFQDTPDETAAIQARINAEFSKVNPADWK